MTTLTFKYSIYDESTSLECLDYYLFSYANEYDNLWDIEIDDSGELPVGYDL